VRGFRQNQKKKSEKKGKKEKKNNNCKFEFRLNYKQPLMFHQGPVSDNKFMSADAAQFCLCKNPTNCQLPMDKGVRRYVSCIVSNTRRN